MVVGLQDITGSALLRRYSERNLVDSRLDICMAHCRVSIEREGRKAKRSESEAIGKRGAERGAAERSAELRSAPVEVTGFEPVAPTLRT